MTNHLPRIDPEFKALIPPLTEDEYRQLEQNILAYKKCRDAIVVWDNTIVDGHNRFRICAEHGVPFEIKEMAFESRDEAKLWILENQLGRRNLTDAMRIELALSKAEMLKQLAWEKQASGDGGRQSKPAGDHGEGEYSGENDGQTEKNETAENPLPDWVCGEKEGGFPKVSKLDNNPINVYKAVAKEADLSNGTVHKYMQILKHGNPQLIEAVKTGQLKIGTAHRLLDSEIIKQLKHADKLYRFIVKNLPAIEDTPHIHEVRTELAKLKTQLEALIESAGAYQQPAGPEEA